MLRAALNKSWKRYPTKHQQCGNLPTVTQTIEVKQKRYVGHSWRSEGKLKILVMASLKWLHQCRPTSKYLVTLVLYGHRMTSGGSVKGDRLKGQITREKVKELRAFRMTCWRSWSWKGWWFFFCQYDFIFKKKKPRVDMLLNKETKSSNNYANI